MNPADNSWLLFLHGINAGMDDRWFEALGQSMSRQGYESLPRDRVIMPDYRAVLKGGAAGVGAVKDTWEAPSKKDLHDAQSKYLVKMGHLESVLRPLSNANTRDVNPPEFKQAPPDVWILGEATRYIKQSSVRAAIQRTILDSLEFIPEGAQLIVLGHSLGSVVAVDVIKKLPKSLRVSALITIGSPLGSVATLRSDAFDEFPFGRLESWVNMFEPRDPVTGGRGVTQHYGGAIDVPLALENWIIPKLIHQHGAEFYCSHSAVGTAVAQGLLRSEVVMAATPSTRVDGLEMPLLQSLYLRELAKKLPSDKTARLLRFERARQVVAVNNAGTAKLIHASSPSTAELSRSEFSDRPDAHIRGIWDDEVVLPLAVMLASSPPAPPFEVESRPDTEERRRALVATLSIVRRRNFERTDDDIAQVIMEARSAIADYMAGNKAWLPAALLAGGFVVLAATGVGLAAAAPAGLAGAAAITSTLAAFGPGGMLGGMATLVALAGASSAALTAGGTLGRTDGGSHATPDLLVTALEEAVASNNVDALRSLLSLLLTLVAAQEKLHLRSQRTALIFACEEVESKQSVINMQHEMIDPRSSASKTVKETLTVIRRALSWLRGEVSAESDEAKAWAQTSIAYGKALEGRPQTLGAPPALPPRDRRPPALMP